MNNQQTMLYQGVLIPCPVLNVDLHALPDFTGRVVVHIENGRGLTSSMTALSNTSRSKVFQKHRLCIEGNDDE